MPLQPFGEYRPDVSDINATYTAAINNVIPRGDGYGPFPGFAELSSAAPATCRGFFKALKSDGSIVSFMGTSTKLYQLDNTTFAWGDVSKASGTYTTLSLTHNWQFAQFGNFVFAVQANTVPQVFDLSSSTEFADLGGSPPQAAYISIVGRFVVLSGLASNPYRIQWSGLNATTTWTSGTNSSDYQDLPDGGITRGVAGGEYGTIFQDGSIRRMIYAPGSPLIFQIERVSEDMGLYAPYSIVRSGSNVFFLSAFGFNRISAGGIPAQIGRERVDRTFLADLDKGNLQLLVGAADPRTSLVYWAYKSVSGSAGLFDKILIYDWALDRWSRASVMGEYIGSVSQPGLTLESLDAISGSLDALPFSLDDVSTAVSPEIGIFDPSHKLGYFRGDNLEATLETSEFDGDGSRFFVRGFRPITDAATVYGSVSKRENAASTRTYTDEALINAQGFIPQRASTRYARGKVRIPAAATWTFASGVEPDATTAGMR